VFIWSAILCGSFFVAGLLQIFIARLLRNEPNSPGDQT
jgi:hypothetical protein